MLVPEKSIAHQGKHKDTVMDITDLVGRPVPPSDWDTWKKIPWDDPDCSARMLENHLSQEHDWASRKNGAIEAHIAFIHRLLPPGARVLDLGCGPGLYTEKLRALGHVCLGVDFSPASIAYARQRPGAESTDYVLEDIRRFRTAGSFDAILLLFGEINVFSRAEALGILANAAAMLRPDGRLFAELHTAGAVRAAGCQPPAWRTLSSSLFSGNPHLYLEEHFWSEERAAAMSRYYILDAETAACSEYASLMQAYTDEEYNALFREAGLRIERLIPDADWPAGKDFAGKLHCAVCSARQNGEPS